MVDITAKSNTLREAIAEAVVRVSDAKTIEAIKEKKVPKGDVFEMSKATGLLGVKKTPELLPDCHPLPIEYTGVDYAIEGLEISIKLTVKTIYKTGVEVEAMHGASVVALNMYDMLKPIDKGVEIGTIRLLSKKGGKTSYPVEVEGLTAQVVVCSDSISKGEKADKAGALVMDRLSSYGIESKLNVIPDDAEAIEKQVRDQSADLLIFTGGTGVGPRDVAPDTIRPLLDSTLLGVEEEMRRYGQERMPRAMFSRSVAGIRNGKIILAFPGSAGAVVDCMNVLFPQLFHLFHVLKGGKHD